MKPGSSSSDLVYPGILMRDRLWHAFGGILLGGFIGLVIWLFSTGWSAQELCFCLALCAAIIGFIGFLAPGWLLDIFKVLLLAAV